VSWACQLPVYAIECESVTVSTAFSHSDIVALVENVNAKMNYREFADYYRIKNPESANQEEKVRSAWNKYDKENDFSLFLVKWVFKGDVGAGDAIRVIQWPLYLQDYEVGNDYVLFLSKEDGKAAYNSDVCLYLDVENKMVERDRTMDNLGTFKSVINELHVLGQ
jgi:hypothetical protein